ncbi:MAG: hypothetical protein GF309_04235 [Candidatus Lokiarchaeota archaeon]|nr:hypothetical protein [Candidatus Lokiarchaeota archaeon]
MADCSIETLQRLLREILEKDESNLGVPLKIAEKELLSKARERGMECSSEMVEKAIQTLLDDWTIDKTLAPLPSELEEELNLEPPGPFWRLKILTSEEQENYRSLSPVKKALIRILRERNEPGKRGEIPIKEAEAILSVQGFEEIPQYMWVKDTVKTSFGYEGEEVVDYYFLVQEHMKTDEFKKYEEEMLDKHREKQRWRIDLMEDSEEKAKKEDGN